MPRHCHFFATAAALVLALTVPAGAREIEQTSHESYEVKPGARFELEAEDGDVHVEVWDRPEIQIDVVYRAEWKQVGIGERSMKFEFEHDETENRVRAKAHSEGKLNLAVFTALWVHEFRWDIKVPADCSLDLRGDDGDIEVANVRANVRIASEDGDIELDDVDAPEIRVRTDDGDVKAHRCRGDFFVRTEDGDISVRRHPAGPLEIRTDDGDVDVWLTAGGRLDLDVESEDGDVEIRLDEGVHTEFFLATDDGSVRVDLDHGDFEIDRDAAFGRIGDASGDLKVKTEEGSIRLASR